MFRSLSLAVNAILIMASATALGEAIKVETAPPLNIAAIELPPFIYNQFNSPQGLFVDILDEAAKRAEHDYRISFMPWARGARELYTGNIQALIPSIKTPEREQFFHYLEAPLYTFRFTLLSNNPAQTQTDVSSLSDRSFAVLRGTSLGSTLDRFMLQEGLNKTVSNNYTSMVKLVAAGRTDHAIMPELTALHYRNEVHADIHVSSNPLEQQNVYMAFSKQAANVSEDIRNAWRKALMSMHQDGTMKRLKRELLHKLKQSDQAN